MQYQLSAADIEIVLALVRGATLAGAGERLGVDASTVFRGVQRIERGLGQRLFERTRTGYEPGELAHRIAQHAEEMEAALEAARSAAEATPARVSGSVRITTTDTLLHGLLAPALATLKDEHPLLHFELHTGNELASLTRRDADIALRRSEEHTSELQSRENLVCRLLLEKKKRITATTI